MILGNSKKNIMDNLFICHIVPSERTKEFNASQAGNNFCLKLINGGCFSKALSIVPPSYDFQTQKNSGVFYLSTFSTNRFFAALKLAFIQLKTAFVAKKCDCVWFYNIWYLNFITYIFCKFFLRKKVYVIFADNTPSKRRFSFENFFFYLVNRANGIISLSARSALDNENLYVKPGIIDRTTNWYASKNKKLKLLISGAIKEYTGVKLLKEWLETNPDYDIYISGYNYAKIDFSIYKNVHYLGLISYEEYLNVLKICNVCLSLRDPHCIENQNNFPSKILEYLSYNKVVISTMVYPELNDFEYEVCDYNLEKLQMTLAKIDKDYAKYEYWRNQDCLNSLSVSSWKELINKIEIK